MVLGELRNVFMEALYDRFPFMRDSTRWNEGEVEDIIGTYSHRFDLYKRLKIRTEDSSTRAMMIAAKTYTIARDQGYQAAMLFKLSH